MSTRRTESQRKAARCRGKIGPGLRVKETARTTPKIYKKESLATSNASNFTNICAGGLRRTECCVERLCAERLLTTTGQQATGVTGWEMKAAGCAACALRGALAVPPRPETLAVL